MTNLSQKRILALKNLEVFWPLVQKLGIRFKNNCLAKIVLTSSICKQSLVNIDKRMATGERKTRVFL